MFHIFHFRWFEVDSLVFLRSQYGSPCQYWSNLIYLITLLFTLPSLINRIANERDSSFFFVTEIYHSFLELQTDRYLPWYVYTYQRRTNLRYFYPQVKFIELKLKRNRKNKVFFNYQWRYWNKIAEYSESASFSANFLLHD